ncbi:MAG: ABC transporter ATP-binding protein [Planctomycetota bacterium]
MEEARSRTEEAQPRARRTLLRLTLYFLPQLPLFAAAMGSHLAYATIMTSRVVLIYPAMRAIAQAAPQEVEEIAERVPVIRTLTQGDREFSGFMAGLNDVLDVVDAKLADALAPILPRRVTEQPQRMAQVGSLCTVICSWLVMMFVAALFQWISLYAGAALRLRVIVSFRERLLGNLLHQPLGFHNDRQRGELISRMSEDANAAMNCLRIMTHDMLRQPFSILSVVAFILFMKPWLLLIVCAVVPFLMVSLRRHTRRIRSRAKTRQRATARVTEAMVQLFSGIRIVKAFGLEKYKLEQYSVRNRAFARRALSTEIAKASTRVRMELLTHGLLLLAIVVAALVLGAGGHLPAGALILFLGMMIQLHRPAKQLTAAYTQLQDNLAGAERMFEFLDLRYAEKDSPHSIQLQEVVGGVRFEDVSFSYKEGDHLVLEHVNIEVPAGSVVALVGLSGAGKSTMVNLVARFYDPDSGRITIDGTDVREYTYASLRRSIAMVTQEPFLFNTTVRENIQCGRPGATGEEVVAAATAANIHDFILTLPEGYDTIVGERGARLSGGECQRLTIARAILRDAPILILDEATSNLDTESERAVQKALHNLMRNRTTLVIAHRLSTVQHADKICVLSEGRIVDIGTHGELMERDSLYRRLYELQFAVV